MELDRAPAHRRIYEAHFRCPVTFESGRNVVVFNRADLDRPFQTHNPDLLAVVAPQLESERHGEALIALARVVDAGWIANWRFSLEHDPAWDPVRQDPAFGRVVETLEERTRAQRDRLHTTSEHLS